MESLEAAFASERGDRLGGLTLGHSEAAGLQRYSQARANTSE